MRYNGEVLELLDESQAKLYANTLNKVLPSFRKHLTLLVEGYNMVIMKNIGYKQYQIEHVRLDMRSK